MPGISSSGGKEGPGTEQLGRMPEDLHIAAFSTLPGLGSKAQNDVVFSGGI